MFNYFSRMFCFCPLQAGLFALIFITVVQFFSCQAPTVEGKYLLKDEGGRELHYEFYIGMA